MIYFNNYRVRKFLIDHNFVFTVRENYLSFGKSDLVFHCRNRGRVKFGTGRAKYIDKLTKNNIKERLKNYVEFSGFSTVANWVYAILSINEWKSIRSDMKLYRVQLISKNEKWRGLIF